MPSECAHATCRNYVDKESQISFHRYIHMHLLIFISKYPMTRNCMPNITIDMYMYSYSKNYGSL